MRCKYASFQMFASDKKSKNIFKRGTARVSCRRGDSLCNVNKANEPPDK